MLVYRVWLPHATQVQPRTPSYQLPPALSLFAYYSQPCQQIDSQGQHELSASGPGAGPAGAARRSAMKLGRSAVAATATTWPARGHPHPRAEGTPGWIAIFPRSLRRRGAQVSRSLLTNLSESECLPAPSRDGTPPSRRLGVTLQGTDLTMPCCKRRLLTVARQRLGLPTMP